MGHLEEALRRAALDKPVRDNGLGTQTENPFVSAWPASNLSDRKQGLPACPPTVESASDSFRGFAPEWRERLVLPESTNQVLIEQFRQVAGALHHAQTNGGLKSLMVTSAVPGDGKTFTAINLALTLAQSYALRVLLVDADMRRPSIGQVFGFRDANGLAECLRSDVDQRLPVLQVVDGLTFLPAGRPDPDPISGLTSPRLKNILHEASERFDWIIVDAPPATPLADAGLIGAIVDASLLVIRTGVTQLRLVEKAVEALGKDRIFGVILNGAEQLTLEYHVYNGDRSKGF